MNFWTQEDNANSQRHRMRSSGTVKRNNRLNKMGSFLLFKFSSFKFFFFFALHNGINFELCEGKSH